MSLSHAFLSLSLYVQSLVRVPPLFEGGASTSCSRRATSSVFLPAGPQLAPSCTPVRGSFSLRPLFPFLPALARRAELHKRKKRESASCVTQLDPRHSRSRVCRYEFCCGYALSSGGRLSYDSSPPGVLRDYRVNRRLLRGKKDVGRSGRHAEIQDQGIETARRRQQRYFRRGPGRDEPAAHQGPQSVSAGLGPLRRHQRHRQRERCRVTPQQQARGGSSISSLSSGSATSPAKSTASSNSTSGIANGYASNSSNSSNDMAGGLPARNPVTGDGIEVTPVRRIPRKYRDGNPVTGIGYVSEAQKNGPAMQNGTASSNSSSSGEKSNDTSPTKPPTRTRVPPGGFSSGLW